MTELFTGIAIGLASPAGLILTVLVLLTLGLLTAFAVKAVRKTPCEENHVGAELRTLGRPAAPQQQEEVEWRRAA